MECRPIYGIADRSALREDSCDGHVLQRALQNPIDESLPYADRSKRRDWVKILNSPTSVKYIPTEWELVILQSLATLGTVQHESNLGGECLALSHSIDC